MVSVSLKANRLGVSEMLVNWTEAVAVCHPCFLEDAPAAFKNGIGFSSTFLTD